MGDNVRRKCVKCGRSPREDREVKLYRFPNPGPTNSQRCELWSKYCFPEGPWSSIFFQRKLYGEHRMLCNKHFMKTSFTNFADKKLNRHAVPDTDHIENQSTNETLRLYSVLPRTSLFSSNNRNEQPQSRIYTAPDKDPGTEHFHQPVTDVFNNLVTEHFHDSDELDKTNGTQLHEETLIGRFSLPDTQSNAENEGSIIYNTKTFSWQRPSEVVTIPADDIEVEDVLDNLSMYCDEEDSARQLQNDQDTNAKGDPKVYEEFRCNVCDTEISGFRYTCVQCHDFDLCGACESNREHQQHYMLRVPTPRPAAEVQAVLATVRRYLMKTLDPIKQLEQDWDDAISVKSEVKSEEEDCDHEDDKPQNKSLGRDTSNSAGTPSVPTSDREHSDDDDCSVMTDVEEVPVTESPAGECVVSTDCTGDIQTDRHADPTIPTTTGHVMVQAPQKQQIENDPLGEKVAEQSPSKPHKKKIVIKLADCVKVNILENATSTDSQHSTNSVPTQNTPSTTHKKILIRVTDFASPAKKVFLVPTSRVTHNQMDSTNLSHITPCSVKLSKLSKPFLNIGQKWSVQPRLPNNDARNKNGEDNR